MATWSLRPVSKASAADAGMGMKNSQFRPISGSEMIQDTHSLRNSNLSNHVITDAHKWHLEVISGLDPDRFDPQQDTSTSLGAIWPHCWMHALADVGAVISHSRSTCECCRCLARHEARKGHGGNCLLSPTQQIYFKIFVDLIYDQCTPRKSQMG